ncbi:MAG: TRAM domain-containing protein, partial [SAR324 cluster bacterium]|nr:TRAM domain-containing protein [SAR324 cluster bacterium]
RSRVPDIALSTDLIVGFPGETEADFQQTLELVRTVGFDHIFSFKFSPRQDTPAAKFDGQLPEAVKADRLARLHAAHENILQEKTRLLVGSRQEILLEGPHPRLKGAIVGRTRGNRSALVIGGEAKPGDLVRVEIIAARKFALVGREIGRGY